MLHCSITVASMRRCPWRSFDAGGTARWPFAILGTPLSRDAIMLGLEAQSVIGLRLMKAAMGGEAAQREAALMVTEKNPSDGRRTIATRRKRPCRRTASWAQPCRRPLPQAGSSQPATARSRPMTYPSVYQEFRHEDL